MFENGQGKQQITYCTLLCAGQSLKVVDIWQSTRTSKLWVKLLLSDVNITVTSTQYDHVCKKIQ